MLALIQSENMPEIRKLAAAAPESQRQRAPDGSSMIQQAMYRRKPGVARLLIELGAQPDFIDSCILGDFDAVLRAVRSDSQRANAFSADGFPPLALAVFMGHRDVAALLLREGAAINSTARNSLKISPLHAAVERGDEALVALLLSHGADPEAKEFLGGTALHSSAAAGNAGVVRLLLRFGADRNSRTNAGETPLDLARKGQHSDAMALLR
jgi:ankyrin repeat protein